MTSLNFEVNGNVTNKNVTSSASPISQAYEASLNQLHLLLILEDERHHDVVEMSLLLGLSWAVDNRHSRARGLVAIFRLVVPVLRSFSPLLSATLNCLPILVGLQEARELGMRTAIPSSAVRRMRMVEIGVRLMVH